ncbi:CLOCK-interacting pacemaker-like [Clarias magur]|uniref:CLOCK-interacting pacemaker-like n=1 Tax=Clarias magur TaxID=1594786 RepID=A0A8J4UUG7_CLAMG|nr:CLOCK-interacting pacemaker-like [Clarias magur]
MKVSADSLPIMPQEPSCVGRRPALPASKNAKDKSNGASLLSRTKVHIQQVKNGRNSRCSSEKDSGYSDAGSDYQQTDVDDQHSTVSELKGRIPSSTADKGNHILVSGQAEFTPMFIIKNVVLKQPGQSAQDQVLQSLWESEGTNAQSNLLFLQQPSITVSPLRVLTSQLRRSESKNKKSKSTYLPILNSYPRIAPNLNKKKPEKPTSIREGSSEEHSLRHLLPTSKMRLSGGSVPDPTTGLTRHRRFLNTVEILSQSGLLDITLRTQELLRQNSATEQNIAQLRHHTNLLCHAVHAGSNMPTLENIHGVMVESGCYPNLRSLLFKGSDGDDLEADSSSRIDAMITYRCGFNEHGEVPPPNHLYTTQQVRENEDIPSLDSQDSTFGMEWLMPHGKLLPHKRFLVPPDSSTCAVAAVDT